LNATPVVEPRRKEAWCTVGGSLRSGQRADPHLDSEHASACRDGSDQGERPAAL
jgi:hypothetical protein